MKSFFILLFIYCSSYAYSQNSVIVLEMLKNAKDSIAANKFRSASRILDGATVYGVYNDSILYWRKELKRKGLALSYKKYKEQSFDMAINYLQDVIDNDSNEINNYYWMNISLKMSFSKRIIAAANLGNKVLLLEQFIQQKVRRKMSKDKYVKVLNAILEADEWSNGDATFLQASQDKATQKWGFMDSHGIVLIPYDYDAIISDFKAGVAIVKLDGIYGLLHYTGISTFNMNDASAWDTIGKGIDNGGTITPNMKIDNKTVKDFLEEIQRKVTY